MFVLTEAPSLIYTLLEKATKRINRSAFWKATLK